MEMRKDSLSALKLCRFCLSRDASLTSLYDRDQTTKKSVPLTLKILSCVAIEVYPSDKMPSHICQRCRLFMDLTYEYKQICRQADEKILQYVQKGTALSSVTWPSILTKFYNAGKTGKEVGIMKTVVESGATVHVSAQDSDLSEDDDGNVYDVKIGDGSGEGPKNARIKVVTAAAKQAKPKRGQSKDRDDSDMSEGRFAPVREGCWPCDECDRSYPLQQLLDLHKRQKHRERTEECDKCDAKFFSQNDLLTHQLRHSEDMIFQCVACDKKFKRLIRLKRHERMVHSDLAQLACPNCPATFLSQEELQAHQTQHGRNAERRYMCPICDKRFLEKATLLRHQENIHNKVPEFSCEYCPERFQTVTKLTKHVREHASERAYPCKYCDKSFIKSHHYTRHLRLKHRETIRSPRGPFGMSDQFKCDQCEDTFVTQDDLIYHSAIHATQNLTCPLCQEKFDNVDAVTAHIKSHANGVEFMCDMCELVFTSKAKLDMHMVVAHEDELDDEYVDGQDETSMDMDAEDDEEEHIINLKEENGEMFVEISKPKEYMQLPNLQEDTDERMENTLSEDSETEQPYTETAEPVGEAEVKQEVATPEEATAAAKDTPSTEKAGILRKAEEVKRKAALQKLESPSEKKDKVSNKSEGGASDKSLRLLEKDLQELKRTNTRSEAVKTPVKALETSRSRRLPQLHTSTPKPKSVPVEEKKAQAAKAAAPEKKAPEKRALTKENKEPKDAKESKDSTKDTPKANNVSTNEEKEKSKSAVKNGNAANDKSASDGSVRRSTRPSRVKDYAKMVRDGSNDSEEEDDSDAEVEPKEPPSREGRRFLAAHGAKPPGASPALAAYGPRKRGRPRKVLPKPAKLKKMGSESEEEEKDKDESEDESNATDTPETEGDSKSKKGSTGDNTGETSASESILKSPTGQTLKKIPINSLPPGVKALPLPANTKTVPTGPLCEMQIGSKMVKVQKIVMTKAEVEAMAKKGLLEMKGSTMVLKQGIKLPASDPVAGSIATALKSSLAAEEAKESPTKKDSNAVPSRCDLEDLPTTS